MNVFEFLGLRADHRKHPVQLVKHIDEVPESKLQWPLLAQEKRDGVFGMLVVHQGRYAIFGRTGMQLSNIGHYAYRVGSKLPDGVYIGEAESGYGCSLEQLSGVLNPNRVNALDEEGMKVSSSLYISFHDFITVDCFYRGVNLAPYSCRHAHLVHLFSRTGTTEAVLPHFLVANIEEAEAFAADLIAQGKEGAVFKSDTGWEAGHKGWRCTKIVRDLHVDLECVGWETGKGKREGLVAKLHFLYKGKKFSADLGKGWDDAKRAALTEQAIASDYPVGKIYHVKALQESSKGVLRLPKVMEERIDKTEPDI